MTVALGWIRQWARHPFAVHFCSVQHKNDYIEHFIGNFNSSLHNTLVSTHGRPLADSGIPRRSSSIIAAPEKARNRVAALPGRRAMNQRPSNTFSKADRIRAHGMGIRLGR